MNSFAYADDDLQVRQETADAHRQTWLSISRPSSYWSDVDRLDIAAQARAARTQRAELPFNRTYPSTRLNETALEVARTVAADAGKINRDWASKQIGLLGQGAYVEMVAVVASVSAIDAFAEALGRHYEPLPEPSGAEQTSEKEPVTSDIGGYVSMVDPWQGPNVSRALSLMPSANQLFMNNVSTMYGSNAGSFYDMVWDGPLSRPQAELLAARVSSINECFY